jgi:membrane fusion protein (multidrug efflux system)
MAAMSQHSVTRISRRRIWIIAILCLAAIIGILAAIKVTQFRAMGAASKSFAIPPESVTSAKVEAVEWQASRSAVGTLVAVRTVTLGSEVAGMVREIGFDSGMFVRKRDMLVKLDTSAEEGQLAAARADASLARASLERARALRASKTNSPADLDAAEAKAKQTAANVVTLQATIAKKTIRVPFDGRISIRQVELGQVLAPGTPIASLVAIHPIHAEFWLPQQALAELRLDMPARLRTDVFPNATWEGAVTVINPEVDVNTRNVRVRATFSNTDGRLRPGMFVNVDVLSPDKRIVQVIPSTAVLYAPYGDSVFAIEEKKDDKGSAGLIAHQKFVRLGERRGDLVSVVSGLNTGETIVSSGAFKLRNGMPVVVRNELAPKVEVSPTPVDR